MNNSRETGISELLDRLEEELAPSFVQISCYDTDDYVRQFCLDYLLDIDESLFTVTKEDLLDIFSSWSDHSESLRKLSEVTGSEGTIVRFASETLIFDLLSGPAGVTFYTLEDLFFLVKEKETWCFMLGNNE